VEMQQAKTSLNSLQSSQLQDIKTIDHLKSHGAEEEMLHNHFLNEFTGAVRNTELLKNDVVSYAQRCHFLESRIENIEQPLKNELNKMYAVIDDNNHEIEALRREREQFSRVFEEKNAEVQFLRGKITKNLNSFGVRSKKDKELISKLVDTVETLKYEIGKNGSGMEATSVVLSKFEVQSLAGGDTGSVKSKSNAGETSVDKDILSKNCEIKALKSKMNELSLKQKYTVKKMSTPRNDQLQHLLKSNFELDQFKSCHSKLLLNKSDQNKLESNNPESNNPKSNKLESTPETAILPESNYKLVPELNTASVDKDVLNQNPEIQLPIEKKLKTSSKVSSTILNVIGETECENCGQNLYLRPFSLSCGHKIGFSCTSGCDAPRCFLCLQSKFRKEINITQPT